MDGAFHHSVPGRAEQQDPLAVCLGDRHPSEPTRSVGSVAKTPGEASDVLFRALCEALHGPGANPVFPIRLPNMAPRVPEIGLRGDDIQQRHTDQSLGRTTPIP